MKLFIVKKVSDDPYCVQARTRRRDNIDKGFCINGVHHGPPVAGGVRCAWCKEVHRRGVDAVLADPAWADRRPPGYKPPRSKSGRFVAEEVLVAHDGTLLVVAS